MNTSWKQGQRCADEDQLLSTACAQPDCLGSLCNNIPPNHCRCTLQQHQKAVAAGVQQAAAGCRSSATATEAAEVTPAVAPYAGPAAADVENPQLLPTPTPVGENNQQQQGGASSPSNHTEGGHKRPLSPEAANINSDSDGASSKRQRLGVSQDAMKACQQQQQQQELSAAVNGMGIPIAAAATADKEGPDAVKQSECGSVSGSPWSTSWQLFVV